MCGIFGYVGKKRVAPKIILEGLKTLEYRGYDSWGVAVGSDEKLSFEKNTGKVGSAKSHLPQSMLGIGHTRWATHGGVTKSNAHPHLSCDAKLAIVHNGIIENYQKLKKSLKRSHKFKSETDTEVAIHLIEEEAREKDLANAVRTTFRRLKGLNAIVVLSSDGQILAARRGSPLVLGIGDEAYFVASDPAAVLPHTKKAVFLEDNQMAAIENDGIKMLNIKSGEIVKPKIQDLQGEVEEAKLGKFKHFMLKEIFEQPGVIKSIAKNYDEQIKNLAKAIRKAKGTFLIGCGSASYAALAGQYLFSRIAGTHVNFSIGSEFNYLEHYLNRQSLVIAISQSGETIDVVEPVTNAKKKGVKIVALTNVLGSTLYRIANHKVLLGAGPEVAVCATKSFIAMVSVLILLAHQMGGDGKRAKLSLKKAAQNVSDMLRSRYLDQIKKLAKKIYKQEHLYVIGRGLSYAAALEATLKLKEVPYVHSEGFAGGELKHGVIALIEKGTPVIVFAPKDETYEAIISNAIEIKSRGGYIIGVSPVKNEAFDYYLPTADVQDASVIPNVVVAQLLSYFLALNRGLEPDKPRNLAKSVTVK